MKKINFFTCCNGIYKNFVPIFILSNLYYNEDSFVEVGVDIDDVSNTEAIKFLKEEFNGRFLIRQVSFDSHIVNKKSYKPRPNLIRFITEPLSKTDYVYISDVDIITLEKDILSKHLKNIEDNSLPYSNIVRKTAWHQPKHLTGLHFTKYENYYPIMDYTDLIKRGFFNQDERFLYQLMRKRHGTPNEKVEWRPVHGIHVSPNRKPVSKPKYDWGMTEWKKEWLDFRNTEIFKKLEAKINNFMISRIKIIDNFFKS